MNKIAIIVEMAYPMLGGQQIRFKDLADTWVNDQNEVSVYSIDALGDLPAEEEIDGVKYYRIVKDPNYYKKGKFGRNISTIFKFTYQLSKIKWKNFDYVIFVQFPILPAIVYGRIIKPKTFLDFVEYRSGFFWNIIQFFLVNSTDYVVVISNQVKERILKYRKKNVYTIPSLVKKSEVKSSKENKHIIFFGRLENHKHPEDAILSVLKYNDDHQKNEEIVIMGDGTQYDELIEKYGSNKNVQFTGRVSDEDKLKHLANAKLLILPSEREGLPLVVIESMAYGIPTVTTNYKDNGTSGFVKDNNVGLVAEPTIEDITKKVSTVLDNLDQYSNQCLNVVKNHDLTINSKKYFSNG